MKSRIKNALYVFLALLFVLCSISTITTYTTSSTTLYTDVLVDLSQDSKFDVADYPIVETDYSISVIQIAESVNDQLFVYVYQPSQNMVKPSSINISTTVGDDYSPNNYKLALIDYTDALYKYLVVDFVVSNDTVRYYDIPSIFRLFNLAIDEPLDNDNTVSEVACEVAKLWITTTVDGQVLYDCQETETIEVTEKYVGFIRYDNGFTLYNKYCDSHYVAFTTDKPMDKLKEAEVLYTRRDIVTRINLTGEHLYSSGEPENVKVKLTDIEKGHNDPHGWPWSYSYEWDRIEKVSEFVNDPDNNLTDSTKESLAGKQWVLRFYESDVDETATGGIAYRESVEVTNVTILRLMFETDGVVYNLGVVDNKQSGDLVPDNEDTSFWDKIKEILEIILYVVLGILVLVIIMPFIPTIVAFLVKLLGYILKGIWWVITLPIRLIKKE